MRLLSNGGWKGAPLVLACAACGTLLVRAQSARRRAVRVSEMQAAQRA